MVNGIRAHLFGVVLAAVALLGHSISHHKDSCLETDPEEMNAVRNHSYIFVAGLGQSGTSLLRQLLLIPSSSGLDSCMDTTTCHKFNAEGQWLLLSGSKYEHPEYFALKDAYGSGSTEHFLTEANFADRSNSTSQQGSSVAHPSGSRCVTAEAMRTYLFRSWSRYWDTSKSFLLEKSPSNLHKVRWLHHAFGQPGVSQQAKIIVVVKNPIANRNFAESRGESARDYAGCAALLMATTNGTSFSTPGSSTTTGRRRLQSDDGFHDGQKRSRLSRVAKREEEKETTSNKMISTWDISLGALGHLRECLETQERLKKNSRKESAAMDRARLTALSEAAARAQAAVAASSSSDATTMTTTTTAAATTTNKKSASNSALPPVEMEVVGFVQNAGMDPYNVLRSRLAYLHKWVDDHERFLQDLKTWPLTGDRGSSNNNVKQHNNKQQQQQQHKQRQVPAAMSPSGPLGSLGKVAVVRYEQVVEEPCVCHRLLRFAFSSSSSTVTSGERGSTTLGGAGGGALLVPESEIAAACAGSPGGAAKYDSSTGNCLERSSSSSSSGGGDGEPVSSTRQTRRARRLGLEQERTWHLGDRRGSADSVKDSIKDSVKDSVGHSSRRLGFHGKETASGAAGVVEVSADESSVLRTASWQAFLDSQRSYPSILLAATSSVSDSPLSSPVPLDSVQLEAVEEKQGDSVKTMLQKCQTVGLLGADNTTPSRTTVKLPESLASRKPSAGSVSKEGETEAREGPNFDSNWPEPQFDRTLGELIGLDLRLRRFGYSALEPTKKPPGAKATPSFSQAEQWQKKHNLLAVPGDPATDVFAPWSVV